MGPVLLSPENFAQFAQLLLLILFHLVNTIYVQFPNDVLLMNIKQITKMFYFLDWQYVSLNQITHSWLISLTAICFC